MRLYTGTSESLIEDSTLNRISDKLSSAYLAHYRQRPSPGEVASWHNSLRSMSQTIQYAGLARLGVMLEYQLPQTTRRLDCILAGRDREARPNAVIVELKQWQECSECMGENMVATFLSGRLKPTPHPSAQVGDYRAFLAGGHSSFYEHPDPVGLHACAYLHNYPYDPADHLFSGKFAGILEKQPVFAKDQVPEFCDFLRGRLEGEGGTEVLERIDRGVAKPNPKLLDHVARMIEGEPAFTLLDEQRVVYEMVLAKAKASLATGRKTVYLVRGGPGTGKSLIALNLLADLMRAGKHAVYATGSNAFTETLKKIIGKKGERFFTYFMHAGNAPADSFDVMVADEAHRIRKDNNTRWTPRAKRNPHPQIDTLIACARVPVFFIDDKQSVRHDEKGKTALILEAAERLGAELADFQLEGQFRCSGSDGFIQWVDNTLGIERTPTVMWNSEEQGFDFRVCKSIGELDGLIRDRAQEGHSARLMAGYCWKWTREPRKDGSLVEDVVIGGFKRPWNADKDATHLKEGIPPASLWAHQSGGLGQVGCVYTAQGFEFDYAGVIFGDDLRYDAEANAWVGDKAKSFDSALKRSGEAFLDLVKNTYRVLLTRGLKGCYVYFLDEETRRFVASRMEGTMPAASRKPPVALVDDPGDGALTTHLPLYSLKAAAGRFGAGKAVEPEGWLDVGGSLPIKKGMFLARVVGKSMEPRIPDGSLCVFEKYVSGSRQGRIVLAQNRKISDPETGGSFTVKKYASEKVFDGEGNWKHVKITLSSINPDFAPIEITAKDETDGFEIVAVFVRVLPEK